MIIGGAGAIGTASAQESQGLEEVTVTGSRIMRRDFEANSPITTVDSSRFEESTTVSLESVINQMPQFVPAVSQFSPVGPGATEDYSGGVQATPGAAALSLRGLGSNRNLVLLDGRRAMPANASMAVNINTIPSAAIQRVETITGGASSVYGADAVAGVVNFITRQNFEGLDFDVQYGQTQEGDGEESRASVVFGTNFADDRGNVLLGAERSQRGEIYFTGRDFFLEGMRDPTSGTGDSFYSAAGWTPEGNLAPQSDFDTVFTGAPAGTVNPNSVIRMNPDGTLYTASSDGSFRYNGGFTNEDGFPFRYRDSVDGTVVENQVDRLAQIPLDRTSIFGRAEMDVSDRVTGFAQVLYTDSSTRSTGSYSPMLGGWRSSAPHGDGIYEPSVDEEGNTLPAYLPGGRFGLNCDPVGGCTKSEAFPTPPELTFLLDNRADPEADWEFQQATRWAGPRRAYVDTMSHQIVAGVEGEFSNRDWTWELYGSSGSTRTIQRWGGILSLARWRHVTGQPNYGRGMFYTGNELGDGFSSPTITCESGLPAVYGVSGYDEEFVPSQDCQDAVRANVKATGHMKQKVAEFNLQGGAFEMPAGQLRFALGSAIRENTYEYLPDVLNSSSSALDLPAGIFPRGESFGETETKEVYGELLVPLLSDQSFAQDLNLELGYRKSFNEPSNDIESYKALIDWRVTDRVRIRGGRQIANRAPNIGELFQASEQLAPFTVTQGDPCSDLNPANLEITANPDANPEHAGDVRALCEQLMGDAAAEVFYSDPDRPDTLVSPRINNLVGNPDLRSEAAETHTLGVVADVTDAMTLTFDYWRIEIEDLISGEIPDVVYHECLHFSTNPSYDPNHPACQQIVRDPSDGSTATFETKFTNQAAIDLAGYDLQVDWGSAIGPGALNLSVLATIIDHTRTRVDSSADWIDFAGTSGPSDLRGVNPYSYDYRILSTLNYSAGDWAATLRWRHLPSIENEAAVTTTQNPFAATDSYNVFNVSGRYSLSGDWELRFGLDNIFDREPEWTFPNVEEGRSAVGTTNANFYDILGRRFYVGFKLRM